MIFELFYLILMQNRNPCHIRYLDIYQNISFSFSNKKVPYHLHGNRSQYVSVVGKFDNHNKPLNLISITWNIYNRIYRYTIENIIITWL